MVRSTLHHVKTTVTGIGVDVPLFSSIVKFMVLCGEGITNIFPEHCDTTRITYAHVIETIDVICRRRIATINNQIL